MDIHTFRANLNSVFQLFKIIYLGLNIFSTNNSNKIIISSSFTFLDPFKFAYVKQRFQKRVAYTFTKNEIYAIHQNTPKQQTHSYTQTLI